MQQKVQKTWENRGKRGLLKIAKNAEKKRGRGIAIFPGTEVSPKRICERGGSARIFCRSEIQTVRQKKTACVTGVGGGGGLKGKLRAKKKYGLFEGELGTDSDELCLEPIREEEVSNFKNNTFHILKLGLMTCELLSCYHAVHAQQCN